MEALYVLVESLNRLWYIPHMQNNIQPLKIKMLIHVICGYSTLLIRKQVHELKKKTFIAYSHFNCVNAQILATILFMRGNYRSFSLLYCLNVF